MVPIIIICRGLWYNILANSNLCDYFWDLTWHLLPVLTWTRSGAFKIFIFIFISTIRCQSIWNLIHCKDFKNWYFKYEEYLKFDQKKLCKNVQLWSKTFKQTEGLFFWRCEILSTKRSGVISSHKGKLNCFCGTTST